MNKTEIETRLEACKVNNLQDTKLAVVDDIEKMVTKANNAALNASSLARKAVAEYSKAAEFSAQAEHLADRGVVQAKELGAKQLLKELQGRSKNASANKKRYNKMSDK